MLKSRSLSSTLKSTYNRQYALFPRLFSGSTSSVDVHTHMYTPKYMDILRRRTDIPRVVRISNTINNTTVTSDRLVILPDEDKEKTTTIGRPIGREYFDVDWKLQYMDTHNIGTSVISLANPWLDFLEGEEAASTAQELNDELQNICEKSNGRLYGFATLPVRNVDAAVKEVERLKSLSKIRGVILGTPGAGHGLDDIALRNMLHSIADNDFMIFLHPHYGVGNEHFHDSGHSLFLALGFPMETTISVSRLIVSGTLDKVPNLKILVAHAGAALPSLIGRLDSCVMHDVAIANRLQKEPTEYFKNMYFDAISYGSDQLNCLINLVGEERIMFGTDNPFFPPPSDPNSTADDVDISKLPWPSTHKVYAGIQGLGLSNTTKENIIANNAKKLLNIK